MRLLSVLVVLLSAPSCALYEDAPSPRRDAYPAAALVWHDAPEVTELDGVASVGPAGGKGFLLLDAPDGAALLGLAAPFRAPGVEAGAHVWSAGPDLGDLVEVGGAYEAWPDAWALIDVPLGGAVAEEGRAYLLEVWCLGACSVGTVLLEYER